MRAQPPSLSCLLRFAREPEIRKPGAATGRRKLTARRRHQPHNDDDEVDYSYEFGRLLSQSADPRGSGGGGGGDGSPKSSSGAGTPKSVVSEAWSDAPAAAQRQPQPGSGGAVNVQFKAAQFERQLQIAHLPKAGSAVGSKYQLNNLKVQKGSFGETSDFGLISGPPKDVAWSLAFAAVSAGTVALFVVGIGDVLDRDPPPPEPEPTCTMVCINGGTCVVEDNFCDCQVGFFGETCAESWGAEYTVNATNGTDGGVVPPPPPPVVWTPSQSRALLAIMVTCSVFGALFGAAWVALVHKLEGKVIWLMLGGLVLTQVGLGVAIFSSGVGLLFLISAAFSAVAFALARSWIPFATAMLRASTEVLVEYPTLLHVAVGASVVQSLWLGVWGEVQPHQLPTPPQQNPATTPPDVAYSH